MEKQMKKFQKNKIFIITIIILVSICLFLYLTREILAPFIMAAFITYLISPLVVKIQSYGYKKWVCVAIITIVLIAVLISILIIFIPFLSNEIEKFKISVFNYYKYFSNYVGILKDKVKTVVPIIERYGIFDMAIVKIHDYIFSGLQQIPIYLMNIFSVFSIIILVPVLVLSMLLDGNKSINAIVTFSPSYCIETVLSIIYEINTILKRFIRVQLIEASFVGVMSVIFLGLLGINFALIIGIISGIVNMISYLGPFIGLILALIVGIIQFKTFAIIIKIIVVYTTIHFLDNNFVQPSVVGRNMNLGPVMMIFAILVGGKICGFLGIIFAVPVTAMVKTIGIMLIKKYKRNIV
jgi:predicted PurR-regulated permease PerM